MEWDLIDMILYKKRHMIAAAVLVPVILVLLLSLNFRIWGGSYTEGDLESLVIQQMDRLENGKREEGINERTFLQFCECVCLLGIEVMLFLLCEMSFGVWLKETSFRPGNTLHSLAVRMNN